MGFRLFLEAGVDEGTLTGDHIRDIQVVNGGVDVALHEVGTVVVFNVSCPLLCGVEGGREGRKEGEKEW